MIWTKRAAGILALVGIALGGCSSTDKLLGSDGSNVSTGGAAGGAGSESLIAILKDGFGTCPKVRLGLDAAGNASCTLALARRTADCSCSAPGFGPTGLNGPTGQQVLRESGVCGNSGQVSCSEYCWCGISLATGDDLTQCREAPEPVSATAGWCYVAQEQGEAETAILTRDCTSSNKGEFRFVGDAQPKGDDVVAVSCSNVIAPEIPPRVAAPLADPCIGDDEWSPYFAGYDAHEVNVQDGAEQCQTGICLVNHFQGRASCRYGQAAGAGDCFLPDGNTPVATAVSPQLEARQANVASICSCQCKGNGPGPYCTCPDSMQCENLVDDLQLGGGYLAGSYCIPKGSKYDASQLSSVCVEPNCGPAHP